MAGLTHTTTHTTLFDREAVDKISAVADELEGDFEKRKEFMDDAPKAACEARLELLRSTCTLLLDRAD